MGLLTKLTTQGSNFTAYDGVTPTPNPLSTPQSPLQIYSLNGAGFQNVNNAYQQYLDGAQNNLPTPSTLDLNGQDPTISPTGQALPYTLNQPS